LPDGVKYEDLDPEPQPVVVQAPAVLDDALPPPIDVERDAEAKRLLRWAKRRGSPDVTSFVSDLLTDEDKAAILLRSAQRGEGVDE
jgi:hypothetical protein